MHGIIELTFALIRLPTTTYLVISPKHTYVGDEQR